MSVHRWTAVLLAAAALGLSGCTTNPGSAAADQFVGSDKCSTCHQAEFKSWQATYHSKMVQPAAQGLLKDAVDAWAKDGKGNAGPAKGNIDGKAYALADVQMVVGSKWKQRYLVKNPATGYHQFLDKQWNSYTKLWEGYGQKNDWETQCTTCHVTGYRVTEFDEKTSSIRKASFAEKNIGCEACHGPGGAHAASGKKTDIFNPRNAPKAEADKVCGYCHIRVENYRFKTGQGSASEQLPHPVVGQTYRAGRDDWTRWYPDQVLLVGIQPEDPVNKNYPKTDLADAFFIDEAAQKSGLFEARKHHQQYQEHLAARRHLQRPEGAGVRAAPVDGPLPSGAGDAPLRERPARAGLSVCVALRSVAILAVRAPGRPGLGATRETRRTCARAPLRPPVAHPPAGRFRRVCIGGDVPALGPRHGALGTIDAGDNCA